MKVFELPKELLLLLLSKMVMPVPLTTIISGNPLLLFLRSFGIQIEYYRNVQRK